MPVKSPLAVVKEKFGGKDKLVDQLVGMLEAPTSNGEGEPKDELRKRLLGAANKKLLHLHAVASTVKDKYGSRDKLVQAAVTALGRTKDKDYATKLGTLSTPRLLDLTKVAERRAKAAKSAKSANA